MRAVLGETFRLLGRHLHLFTLLSLTVWLPTHILLNYLEFFDPGEEAAGRALRIVLTAQVVLDPFVVSAMLSALVHIKRGGPVSYWQALAEGFTAWPRLMLVRFMVIWVLLMPSLGWLAIYTAGPMVQLVGGAFLVTLAFDLALRQMAYCGQCAGGERWRQRGREDEARRVAAQKIDEREARRNLSRV